MRKLTTWALNKSALRFQLQTEPETERTLIAAEFFDYGGFRKSKEKTESFASGAASRITLSNGGFDLIYGNSTGEFEIWQLQTKLLTGRIQPGDPHVAEFHTGRSARIFGFGAATDEFDRDRASFNLLNLDTMFYSLKESSYSSFPFFLIADGGGFTGVLFNSTYPMRVKTGDRVRIEIAHEGENCPVDVTILRGNPAKILRTYAKITGHPSMPPLWALGYHQSRWSYKTQDRALAIAERFRREGLPMDALHLDIHYMEGYRVFTWNKLHFSEPEKLSAAMENLGVKLITINDPGIKAEPGYRIHDEAVKKNLLCLSRIGEPYVGKVWPGKTVFPDFSLKQTRKWWTKQHGELLRRGVTGIWNDMNDPVLLLGPAYDPFAEDIRHARGSHREIRNVYANYEAEAAYKAIRRFLPDEKPFVLTRSAFCGIQKHSAVWTGDNYTSWQQLRTNLNMVINLGLSGVPFCGADIGGFGARKGIWGALRLTRNDRLFSRWMELGSLMPFFRGHTVLFSVGTEPWRFSEEVLANCRKHMLRRYRLLPYIQTLFESARRNGSPVVRPLFYHYPDDPRAYRSDQFLLGRNLLAAPVLDKGMKKRGVYLPAGDWYEYESGELFLGGREVEFSVSDGYYPLFVRAGTVLPVCRSGRNAAESLASGIILEVYPGENLKGSLYLDDGKRNGRKLKLKFRGGTEKGKYFLKISREGDNRLLPEFHLRLPDFHRLANAGLPSVPEGIPIHLTGEDRRLRMTEYLLPGKTGRVEFRRM